MLSDTELLVKPTENCPIHIRAESYITLTPEENFLQQKMNELEYRKLTLF